ncbi:GMC family oxidoreductase [Sporosarcina sp. P7]|uniref:GMC family oxidoreductase n=1 Tax=Sporosarcina sp. P7 TaxID=2048244 RepID=UPI000C16F5C4|nr:GMC family oxidoreductase [Sporosarcina sp. P7]PID25249.1 dehydrogenase [Sporosarcina sp. P7]
MNRDANNQSTFDYIVVGTGPAGATIARKLTDTKQNSVLVLEAEDNNSKEQPIRDSLFALPSILTDDFFPRYFWQGKSVPQKNVMGRSFDWTGGRTLGGGTSINNNQYVRPSQANMKQWENLLGPLWSPEQETYQFSKLENYNGQTENPNARGYNGQLDIRQAPANPTTMAEKLVRAMEKATGFKRILDYNDPNTPLGPFTRWQLYQTPYGQRESADTAFLSSDVVNENGEGVNGRRLVVSVNSTVQRVIFDNERRAIGVEFLKEGRCYYAYARKKVILSAGINSPQLLLLSGIGPSDSLNKAGIPVVHHNANVGMNMTTHPVNTTTFTTNPNDKALPDADPYALYTGGAFLPDPTPGADPNRRGVQLIGQIGTGGMLSIVIILLEPKSQGSVKIQNGDPLKIVLADADFLNKRSDLETIKNIYRVYIKNIATELSKIDSHYQLVTPSLETIHDENKLEKFIQENVGPTHHIQGTLRMAPNEENGVVNAAGEVYGVKDLIVADDSIAPFVSDGNTSAPAFFIGANIAEHLVRQDRMNSGEIP